ncbi:MAG: hypothetical protein K2P93_08105 [Alphaproteobacteria bacterium]|nr:hypothetical protein [Alphaproteobacteria bacterium]
MILAKNGKELEARKLIKGYIKKHEESAPLLTDLACTYKISDDEFEKNLWKAIKIEPNIEKSLTLWLAIQNEKGGEEGYKKALLKVVAT